MPSTAPTSSAPLRAAQIAFGDRFQISQDARLRECNYGDLTGSPSVGFKNHLAG
jgi:broad specificity phosphatase PhoE